MSTKEKRRLRRTNEVTDKWIDKIDSKKGGNSEGNYTFQIS